MYSGSILCSSLILLPVPRMSMFVFVPHSLLGPSDLFVCQFSVEQVKMCLLFCLLLLSFSQLGQFEFRLLLCIKLDVCCLPFPIPVFIILRETIKSYSSLRLHKLMFAYRNVFCMACILSQSSQPNTSID